MMGTNDDAVSPVIGVMLMLVVTIVIAAVIAVFASGTVGDIEESSNVILKLEDYNIDVVASGGITGSDDISALCDMDMYGAILGKALYEGRIDLKDALHIAGRI